jgi:hypothetical protein
VSGWLRRAEASSSPRGPSRCGRNSQVRRRRHPLSPHGGLTRTRKFSSSSMTSMRPSSGPESGPLLSLFALEQPETRTTRLGRNGRVTTPQDSSRARTSAPDRIGPRSPSGRLPSSAVSSDFFRKAARTQTRAGSGRTSRATRNQEDGRRPLQARSERSLPWWLRKQQRHGAPGRWCRARYPPSHSAYRPSVSAPSSDRRKARPHEIIYGRSAGQA